MLRLAADLCIDLGIMVGMTDLGQSSDDTTGDRTGYHARQIDVHR